MLRDLGPLLRDGFSPSSSSLPKEGAAEVVCSALWSDIGKQYYAKKGWAAFPSLHVEFPVAANADVLEEPTPATTIRSISTEGNDLETLCARDEQLLRRRLAQTARNCGRTCVAFAPDRDTLRWHLSRDDFIASVVYRAGAAPLPAGYASASASPKGALAGEDDGRRVWGVWARNYGGVSAAAPDPALCVDKNTLYILRLVVESDEDEKDEEETAAAFAAVMRAALREARAWHLGKVHLWNPSPAVRRLVDRCGLRHAWADRDTDSIPSMMWYGGEDAREVEWVANEKYCWC
ncbi:hypothetical protein GGR52DRAFT_538341 [Hypoxylon sp. FL1284]|nr:hypothetical protein GGR52DRAFT_538341 [Hypoxylon sp. FL1284]